MSFFSEKVSQGLKTKIKFDLVLDDFPHNFFIYVLAAHY